MFTEPGKEKYIDHEDVAESCKQKQKREKK